MLGRTARRAASNTKRAEMSYQFYKIIHLSGILMIFLALGGVIHHVLNGGSRGDNKWRRTAAITHGIGMLLALVGGFGAAAKLQIHWPWPGWLLTKVVIWLLLGGAIGVAYRKPDSAAACWWATLVLGVLAAALALLKPY